MNQLKAIWAYRFFILSSIKTEFSTRFATSKLGAIWMVIHPLAQVAVYALVLSAVLKAKLPNIDNQYAYAIYLMAGTLGWNLFSELFGKSLNIFIENGNLIKKMSFPKITLPLIAMGSVLVNNILMFIAILVVFGLLGHFPTEQILWLPLLMIVTLALGLGLGLMLGIINVFVRDIGQIAPIVLNFWFWLTPIVYVADALPAEFKDFFYYNPMTGVVMGYQNILVYNKAVDMNTLIYPAVLAICSLLIALIMYFKANEEMADVL